MTHNLQIMAALYLIVIIMIATGAFNIGVYAARLRPRLGLAFFLVSWALLLTYALRPYLVTTEQYLLAIPGYIFFRNSLFFPCAALMIGVVRGRVPEKKHRALRLLLVFLSFLTVLTFQWGLTASRYDGIEAKRDDLGIYRASSRETAGAASCATVLAYYGVAIPEGQLAQISMTTPENGASVLGMCNALRFGLRGSECAVRLRKVEYEKLADVGAPYILVMNHETCGLEAMVGYFSAEDGILVADPRSGASGGLVRMDAETFRTHWSGYVIEVIPPWYLKPGLNTPAVV